MERKWVISPDAIYIESPPHVMIVAALRKAAQAGGIAFIRHEGSFFAPAFSGGTAVALTNAWSFRAPDSSQSWSKLNPSFTRVVS